MAITQRHKYHECRFEIISNLIRFAVACGKHSLTTHFLKACYCACFLPSWSLTFSWPEQSGHPARRRLQMPQGLVKCLNDHGESAESATSGHQASPAQRYGSRETTTGSKPPCQPRAVGVDASTRLGVAQRQRVCLMFADYGNLRFVCRVPETERT